MISLGNQPSIVEPHMGFGRRMRPQAKILRDSDPKWQVVPSDAAVVASQLDAMAR
jgi:hypothetical protein